MREDADQRRLVAQGGRSGDPRLTVEALTNVGPGTKLSDRALPCAERESFLAENCFRG